ncbi:MULTISPECIES: SDR family oxidoreductase [Clavibacter]|uniref:NAD(P)H-binding protein n=1 Tax=Clavibacter seminis TaxID=2860285 RepID=A0ABY3T8Y8_9MICO|nr:MULTISPECIES: NAD(P)H-binding protein [Clavibacter]UKF24971.1 NAD(P)H-binding protein [Clavibacter sp. A6099]
MTGLRVMSRDARRLADLPDGVEGVVGDLGDPYDAMPAFDGVEQVFLALTGTPTELYETTVAVDHAVAAGVRRIVYLSVQDLDRAPQVPHNSAKLAVESLLEHSGVEACFLRVNNFFQNDVWYLDAIRDGVYPQPLGGTGVSRVDVRDIAEVAVSALVPGTELAGPVDVAGPTPWTGEATAAALSDALGRTVTYGGDDLVAWREASLASMPSWLVYDYERMYSGFQRDGLIGSPEAIARLRGILGHAPRAYEDYVRELLGPVS